MKNIFLGYVVLMVFLPQMSFGANQPTVGVNQPVIVSPQQAACNQQIGQESDAFWAQQVLDRQAFIKANSAALTQEGTRFKTWADNRMALIQQAKLAGQPTSGISATPPAVQDAIVAAFIQKQGADKAAFLAKLNQDMQKCMGASAPAG